MNSALLFLGGIGLFEMIFICLIFIVPFIVWIWAIVDATKSEFKDSTSKVVWLLLICLLPFLGTILYFAIGRSQKTNQ